VISENSEDNIVISRSEDIESEVATIVMDLDDKNVDGNSANFDEEDILGRVAV